MLDTPIIAILMASSYVFSVGREVDLYGAMAPRRQCEIGKTIGEYTRELTCKFQIGEKNAECCRERKLLIRRVVRKKGCCRIVSRLETKYHMAMK